MESSRIYIKKPSGWVKLGNTYCLYLQGEVLLHIGPDWGFNLCILSLILSAIILFFTVMAPRVEPLFQYLGCFVFFTTLISYSLTALKNPGLLTSPWEIELEEGESKQKICKICSVAVSDSSEHCSDCQVCVTGYDHHCPLSGKCIGSGNIIPFYIFLVSVFVSMAYFALWFIIITKDLRNKA